MRLTLVGADLARAISWASRVCPTSAASPGLAGLRLLASERLDVQATDLDSFATARVSADVRDCGSALVSARLLQGIAKLLPEGDVHLQADGRSLSIECRAGRWRLPLMDDAAFPVFPDAGGPLGTAPAAELAAALKRVSPVVSRPDLSPLYGCVAIATDERLTIAATDRYRLACAEVEWQRERSAPDLHVYGAALRSVIDAGSSGEVALRADDRTATFDSGPCRLTTRLVSTQYLNWRQAFEHHQAVSHAVVVLAELRASVDRAGVVMGEADTLVIEVGPDGIDLTSTGHDKRTADELGDSEQHCEVISYDGPPTRFGVGLKYLREVLAHVDSPHVALAFPERPTFPVLVRDVVDGKPAPGYRHLLHVKRLSVPVGVP